MQSRKSLFPSVIEILVGCIFQDLQALTAHGVMKVSEESCDIHDVTKAASQLVATACNLSTTSFDDGITRLRFSSRVSSFVDEIIQSVDEGVISAWQGMQEIRAEHAELEAKALFYAQNSIGVLAGAMQIEAGIAVTGASGGLGAVPGALLVGHGANNIAEGVANIYNGPNAPSTHGPIRRGYQAIFRDNYSGNMVYYSTDILLSGYGMFKSVRKPETVQLFRNDPISNERVYQQTGKLALFFEGLVDAITLNSLYKEEQSTTNGR